MTPSLRVLVGDDRLRVGVGSVAVALFPLAGALFQAGAVNDVTCAVLTLASVALLSLAVLSASRTELA